MQYKAAGGGMVESMELRPVTGYHMSIVPNSKTGGKSQEKPAIVPILLFNQGNDIFSIGSDGTNLMKLVSNSGTSVLLDFDYQEERLYWFDRKRALLHRIYLNGTKRERMRAVGKGAMAFTLDRRRNLILWAKQQKGTIEWTDRNEKKSRILLRGLFHPTFIAVDPTVLADNVGTFEKGLDIFLDNNHEEKYDSWLRYKQNVDQGRNPFAFWSHDGCFLLNVRFLFWSSNGSISAIQKANLDGTKVTSVIEIRGAVKGLTLDTADKKIYWIMSKRENGDSSIGSCTYNGDFARVVKFLGQQSIFGLSLFSDHIFYAERKSGTIRRISKYTGEDTVTIILKPSFLPITDVKVVLPLRSFNASISYAGSATCMAGSKHCTNTCEMDTESWQCSCKGGFELSIDGKHCEDINECALWNHGCTLGCENTLGSYFCTCPKGYVLLPDSKTCHDESPCQEAHKECSHGCVQTDGGPLCFCPGGSVLAEDGKTCRGCTSPDNGGCSQICTILSPGRWQCDCFPGYNLQMDNKSCLASGPRPFLMFANVHDIRQINFDGTNYKTLLDSQIGRVFALDYDPVENRIYFAHTALKWIESAMMDGSGREKVITENMDTPEGLSVDAVNRKLYWTDREKSCIERSDLNGKNREIIIQENVHHPRGICVHPLAKRLFWTDIGVNPNIESSNLEGSERMVLVSVDLVWPSGITVDFLTDKLYWCDSKRSVIESSDLDGSNRQTLSQNEVGHPFDIAVFEDHIWFSDWIQPAIIRMEKRNSQNWIRLQGNMQRPSSVVVVHPLAKPGMHLGTEKTGISVSALSVPFNSTMALANADHISQRRNEIDRSNQTANYESFLHGLLATNIYETGIREDTHTRNGLVAEILVSDESGCTEIHCDINAHCVPSQDGPRCQCLEGFTGNGKSCHDIDECTLYITACSPLQAECMNTDGGYICKCLDGYTGNGLQCLDIDECSLGTHRCGENVLCTNTEGNYTCTHTNGLPGTAHSFSGSSTTASTSTNLTSPAGKEFMRECPSSHDGFCFNGGVCIHFPELREYGCRCVLGYVGERCQFVDLETWELYVTQLKTRNVSIAVSLIVLFLLICLGCFATYHYRHQLYHRNSQYKAEEKTGPASIDGETASSREPGCLVKVCNEKVLAFEK
ncbi:pro-epidermal growth factor [Rhinophrynus dorsalis]